MSAGIAMTGFRFWRNWAAGTWSTIDTGHKRRLPGMFAGLADWAGINSGSL